MQAPTRPRCRKSRLPSRQENAWSCAGRSGCGKTTLTRLANGLAGGFWEGRRTGSVRIEGRNVDELEEWRLADHIAVIDDGRVVEEGSHGLLLERKGLYARLWELQGR